MKDVQVLQVVPADNAKEFAKLPLFDQGLLIDAVPVLLPLKHLLHFLETDIRGQFFLFSCQKFHKLLLA
jgi:hypothetical protein